MKHGINTIRERDIILLVNIFMTGAIILLLFYYVMLANSITSKNYKIQSLREKVSALTETNSTLMSKKLSFEIPAAILEFAQKNGLVEAKNILYIFENKNVALQR